MQSAAATAEIGLLYADHADWLRGWLKRHTRCPQKAADLAQDTFCRLLERLDVPALDSPKSYLVTVARRLLIDDARRARVGAAFLEAHAALMQDAAAPAPDRIAEAISDVVAVVRALDALPERPRKAYLMARLDGLTHDEIARRLGVSKSMVKQYVAKAYAHCYAATYGQPGDHA